MNAMPQGRGAERKAYKPRMVEEHNMEEHIEILSRKKFEELRSDGTLAEIISEAGSDDEEVLEELEDEMDLPDQGNKEKIPTVTPADHLQLLLSSTPLKTLRAKEKEARKMKVNSCLD